MRLQLNNKNETKSVIVCAPGYKCQLISFKVYHQFHKCRKGHNNTFKKIWKTIRMIRTLELLSLLRVTSGLVNVILSAWPHHDCYVTSDYLPCTQLNLFLPFFNQGWKVNTSSCCKLQFKACNTGTRGKESKYSFCWYWKYWCCSGAGTLCTVL